MKSRDFVSLFDLHLMKILSMAMEKPVTVQEVSEELDIPPATCYRKFRELMEKGLLVEAEKILVEKQKRRTAYIAVVEELKIEVSANGIKLNWKVREKPIEMWDTIKRIK